MRGGDYVASELQIAVDKQAITIKALQEARELGHDRKCWLVFASGVDHAKHIADELNIMGIPARAVYSGMEDKDRDAALRDLANGTLQALVNNNILTTGYDNVKIDLILMLRPTGSSRLWVQMLGRGTRPWYMEGFDLSTKEGRLGAIMASPKHNCMILDFAANIRKLGPINDPVLPRKKGEKAGAPAPVKLCMACNTYNHASVRHCTNCGAEFVFITKLKVEASTQEMIKGKVDLPIVETFKVDHITYTIHSKVGSAPIFKVTYYCGLKNFTDFICVQHEEGSYAVRRARQWWQERSTSQMPRTTDDALDAVNTLRVPTHISVWLNQKYPSITAYCFDGSAFGQVSPSDAMAVKPPGVVTTRERARTFQTHDAEEPTATIDLEKAWDKSFGKMQTVASKITDFLDGMDIPF